MKTVQFKILKNNQILADKCRVADSFLSRLKGLIGRPQVGVGEGMFFPRCQSVHMWLMNSELDLIFLKEDSNACLKVSSMIQGAKPWSVLPFHDFRAHHVLELGRGSIQASGLKTGDEICIV